MTKPNPARPWLTPLEVPERVTALTEKIASLLDRLDGSAPASWRDDMDVSIAWRRWLLDAGDAHIDPVTPLLLQMPEDQYDRAYHHVFNMAKVNGTAPGDPQTKKRQLDLYLSSLATVPLVEAGRLLGIGKNRCYELAKTGAFPVPVIEVIGKLRVSVLDIEDFVTSGGRP